MVLNPDSHKEPAVVRSDTGRTESVAAIARHPLHPFRVAFPIAFLIGGFLSDIMLRVSNDAFWIRTAGWLIGAGLVTGVVAAVAGLIDFLSIKRARSLTAGWVHLIGNVLALGITAVNFWLRMQAASLPGTLGIILSAIVVLLFSVTGSLGGELTFRHHIGRIRNGSRGINKPID